MPHAIVNGARLWYDTLGNPPPEAEVLLLHHGYTASRVNWMPVAKRLQDTYRVVLMECRGTGDSEDTLGGYNLEQYAKDVIGIADHLGLAQFTYAGHSMGGGMGFLLGLDYAARLQRLILMAPIPSGGTSIPVDPTALEQRTQARARGDRDFFKREMLANRFRDDVQTDAWFESRVDHLLRVSDGHLRGGRAAMQALNVTHRLPQLTIPTLMLAGAVDGLLPANLQDYLCLPNASLHVFSRAGHDVAIHEPKGVGEAIDAFMQHGPVANKMPGQISGDVKP
jgi:pimeloyl-ACP methyl ester carboxylesterase